MLVFPNAKINIGLNIIDKRADGYHNIESCFYPVPWYDALEVIDADKLSFASTGIPIPGNTNICLDAYNLMADEYGIPPVKIHLHKNIPIGAGLGGGSADGAFMLKLLNEKFNLNLDNDQLRVSAAKLGSDCPFFIENKASFVEGTGDIMSTINLDLTGLYILIVYPNRHIGTEAAYSGITPMKPEKHLLDLLKKPIQTWRGHVNNAFEKSTSNDITKLKTTMYSSGAIYSSMTGSGSAVYGLFKDPPSQPADNPSLLVRL